MNIKNWIPLIAALAIIASMFLPSCANTTQAPSGGKKDTIPPYIVDIKPLPGEKNVALNGAQIVFTFNEYFSIKNQKNILLSPPPAKKEIKAKVKGKNLVISFMEPLLPNTTYTLCLDNALADYNEGNMFEGYTYVFSTGSEIDSMMVTGTVVSCENMEPLKEASVVLYKDEDDSCVVKRKPIAVCKSDKWGFFVFPYLKDTSYRIFAIEDKNNDHKYDPNTEKIAFLPERITPVTKINDTISELMKFDMFDTLACLSRKSEYTLIMFRDAKVTQFLKNTGRPESKKAYVTFNAPNAYVDSLWIGGIPANRLISQFNRTRDSLEIWINDRRQLPDTLNLFVNYLMNDKDGSFKSTTDHKKLAFHHIRKRRRDIVHKDTICNLKIVYEEKKLNKGVQFVFDQPLINESFNDMKLLVTNVKQKTSEAKFSVTMDTLNPRAYHFIPENDYAPGMSYEIVIPHRAFRDIYGYYSDSTSVQFKMPANDESSTLSVNYTNVKGTRIIDLLSEKGTESIQTNTIFSDTTIVYPYLDAGKYRIKISCDENNNGTIDTGAYFEKRLPEKVYFYKQHNNPYIPIPKLAEVQQTIKLED